MYILIMPNDIHISKQVAAELKGMRKTYCYAVDCDQWFYVDKRAKSYFTLCSKCAESMYTKSQLQQMEYYQYGSRAKYSDQSD